MLSFAKKKEKEMTQLQWDNPNINTTQLRKDGESTVFYIFEKQKIKTLSQKKSSVVLRFLELKVRNIFKM